MFEHQVRRLVARHKPIVVAVAGSVGKTSTKTAIATVLSQKYTTLVHQGNYNSELGLPLSVFELSVPRSLINPFAWGWRLYQSELMLRSYPYRALVLELGTDHPGEIPRYTRYLRPDVAVISAVTPEHMENFPGGLDDVAAEELALVKSATRVLASYDDILPVHRHRYVDPHPNHVYYGTHADADYIVRLEASSPIEGSKISLKAPAKSFHKFDLASFGLPSAKSALAAYAVGDMLELSQSQLKAGLAAIRPVAGRMNPLAGVGGATIIDDTYNSSPEAAIAALEALGLAAVSGKRIAILGSMNELGAKSADYHRQVGRAAAGVDWLITIGEMASDHLGPAALEAGLDPTRWKAASSPYAAGEFVRLMLSERDVVLVKGSQNGVFAEEATKLLLADPNDAARLVRQSTGWERIKRSQFPDES